MTVVSSITGSRAGRKLVLGSHDLGERRFARRAAVGTVRSPRTRAHPDVRVEERSGHRTIALILAPPVPRQSAAVVASDVEEIRGPRSCGPRRRGRGGSRSGVGRWIGCGDRAGRLDRGRSRLRVSRCGPRRRRNRGGRAALAPEHEQEQNRGGGPHRHVRRSEARFVSAFAGKTLDAR